MESIGQLRKVTGDTVNYDTIVEDEKVIGEFASGNCDGIFQFETKTPRDILKKINCNGFLDIVAASSMNRPGPLSLKMPEAYAQNKANIEDAKQSAYYAYTADSYGTIIYQEQLQQICVYIAHMEWSDADKMLKLMKHGRDHALVLLEENKKNGNDLKKKFYDGCKKYGLSKSETENLFENMLVYSFVKGHGTGYSLISVEEMYYKVYYPNEYWYSKLAYARNDADYNKFCEKAVHDGAVIFLPHVNYSISKTRLRKVEGEMCLQQGLSDLKNVGEKAAEFICAERKENGIYTSFDNFYDRCKNRVVTSRVVDILKEQGALEFDKSIYLKRVTKYNSALYSRALK
jgi:DNA polymerase-3 subunit alpha